MTYKHYNAAVDCALPFDTSTQRYIFLESCYRADNKGVIRVSMTELASILLLSRITIAKEYSRLLELRLLDKYSYGKYRVLVDVATVKPPAVNKTINETTIEKPTSMSDELMDWLGDHIKTRVGDKKDLIVVNTDWEEIPDYVEEAIRKGNLILVEKGRDKNGDMLKVFDLHD